MKFIFQRLIFYIGALLVAITLNFFIPRAMPGDPATMMFLSLRGRLGPERLAQLKATYGFDGTLWDQFIVYLQKLAVGDFGISTINFPAPASEMLFYSAGWTLYLMGLSTILCFSVGVILGIHAAWRRGKFFDSFFTPFNVILTSFPAPVVALLLFYGFALEWELFPIGRAHDTSLDPGLTWEFISNVLYHSVLPVFSIFIIIFGNWHLGMRNTMINLLNDDFIIMAKAKGLSERRVMYRYAARNAILPNITALSLSIGYILGGALITEAVFNYPGLGKFTLTAIQQRDYSFIQGQMLLLTVTMLVANLISDLLNVALDPRLRYAGAK